MSQQPPALEELFDRFVGIALARQCAFADSVPTPFWEWKYEATEDRGSVEIPNFGTFEVQFLGSESYVSNTWLSAWANQSVPTGFANASYWLHENCGKIGDARLGEEHMPLDELNGDYVGVIATSVLNASVYIALPISNGQGASFQVLFDVPLVNFAPTPLGRINTVIQMIEQSTQVTSVTSATHHYLLDEGFDCEEIQTAEGFDKVFKDSHGREVKFVFKEIEENGEKVYEVTRSLSVTEEEVPKNPDHFDVQAQWDALVRAPLSRQINMELIPQSD